MRTVDDPEILVTSREVEDLLVIGKDDERRKAEFGANRDDVFFRVFHDPSCFGCGVRRQGLESRNAQDSDCHPAEENTVPPTATELFHRLAPFVKVWCCCEPWSS